MDMDTYTNGGNYWKMHAVLAKRNAIEKKKRSIQIGLTHSVNKGLKKKKHATKTEEKKY